MAYVALLASLLIAAPTAAQTAAPSAAQTQAARSRGPCADPWVTIALEQSGVRPTQRLCNIALYANGRWGSYDELIRAVRARNWAAYDMREVRISGNGPLAGKMALGVFSGGNLVAAGGNLVAAGGGNLVAAGGGNILNIVGNQLVSPGGGSYSLQSTGRAAPVMN